MSLQKRKKSRAQEISAAFMGPSLSTHSCVCAVAVAQSLHFCRPMGPHLSETACKGKSKYCKWI